MRQLVLILTMIILGSSSAFAQKIKVRKVKGNTAIVESTSPLAPGAVYDLISQDQFGDDSGPATRDHFVGLNLVFGNTKSDAANSTNETTMNLMARFGWNLATFEFGPLVQMVMTHANDVTATTWKAGGFGDYNLSPNITGEAFVYGLTAWGAFGNEDRGNGTKMDLVDMFGGLFIKWFPTSSSACFRIDFGYQYERQTVSGGYYTDTGITGSAGIFAYF
ncbi:hypothetical protein B9G69_011395 [Bdellovibrio sp. SKB1291214]|uniref:hypothetical protein n=1 Tax=Bdellovibrio sp. SKB1291214 TaxID=1732569 RepID=UPI000B51B4A4|nr:hypothetical protein [Bdellovibrio sp. SKB1291214]UYL07651.1 hypothetical protein B9G69_011395 [Bdellovibrio sp. SKB1291214]